MNTTSLDDHVLQVGLARPERDNAITTAMLGDLAAAYKGGRPFVERREARSSGR
jgi:enoyl-CoA hydratase/carnithine racemase